MKTNSKIGNVPIEQYLKDKKDGQGKKATAGAAKPAKDAK